jgi:hypothetical protein
MNYVEGYEPRGKNNAELNKELKSAKKANQSFDKARAKRKKRKK